MSANCLFRERLSVSLSLFLFADFHNVAMAAAASGCRPRTCGLLCHHKIILQVPLELGLECRQAHLVKPPAIHRPQLVLIRKLPNSLQLWSVCWSGDTLYVECRCLAEETVSTVGTSSSAVAGYSARTEVPIRPSIRAAVSGSLSRTSRLPLTTSATSKDPVNHVYDGKSFSKAPAVFIING